MENILRITGISSLLGNRFDMYKLEDDWIVFDKLRFCSKDRIHRTVINKNRISFIECGKHLSYSYLFTSFLFILSGIFTTEKTETSLFAIGIFLFIYTIYLWQSASIIIHTNIGTFVSGIWLKENENLLNWYTGKEICELTEIELIR